MLYDTKTRKWWDPFSDVRTAQPDAGTEGIALYASPDRTWGLVEGKILSLRDAATSGEWSGNFCGWLR